MKLYLPENPYVIFFNCQLPRQALGYLHWHIPLLMVFYWQPSFAPFDPKCNTLTHRGTLPKYDYIKKVFHYLLIT